MKLRVKVKGIIENSLLYMIIVIILIVIINTLPQIYLIEGHQDYYCFMNFINTHPSKDKEDEPQENGWGIVSESSNTNYGEAIGGELI